MRSLQESLFDNDLKAKDLPIEKVLKYFQQSKDLINSINLMIIGMIYHRCPVNANRPPDDVIKWAIDLPSTYKHKVCTYGNVDPNDNDSIIEDAVDWIKIGKIHDYVCFNDKMYASSLDISHDEWEPEDDVIEWIMWPGFAMSGRSSQTRRAVGRGPTPSSSADRNGGKSRNRISRT